MNRHYLLVLAHLFLIASRLPGQNVYDVYSYTIPQDYKSEIVENSIILSAPDDKLTILLLPLKPCNDIAYNEFGKDWNLFVTSKYSVLGFPNRVISSFPGEWEMTTGQSKVLNGESTMWIQIRNFTKQGKKATVIFFAVDDKQQETIKQFINGLKLSDAPVNVQITAQKKDEPVPNLKVTVPVAKGKSYAEIWMRIKLGEWNMSGGYYSGNYYDLSKNRMAYTILFPDGNYTGNEIPRNGLLGFSKNSPEASGYTWGTYSNSANTLHIKSEYEDIKLVYKSEDVLESPVSSFLYYRCKPVDGLKLNGSWSYIPNSEEDPYYDEPGCRQVIHFNEDMTFNDRGVFVSDCRYPNRYPEDAPGSGTYYISDFTLVLKYSDGRIVHKSFTGALMNDPFTKNEIIYIGGNNFFKRNKEKDPSESTKKITSDNQKVQSKEDMGKYDNFLYKLPAGWTSSESPQFLELFPERSLEGEIFSILLLKGKTSSASLQDELAIAWDEFAGMMGAQKLMEVSGTNYNKSEISKTIAGWEYISGHGSIRTNSDFFVHAYIIRVNERIERVIVLAKEIVLDAIRNNIDPTVHNYSHYTTITDFIFNLRFSNFQFKGLPEPSFKGTGIVGVWAGIGFMGGQLKATYTIFFTNGQVYYGSRFPLLGLYGLDTKADKERIPRYWGNFTFDNNSGIVNMPFGSFPIRLEDGKLIMVPYSEEHRFIRIPSVDDSKLDGKWMIKGENDLSFTITFRKDGTFSDNGALKVLDHPVYFYYSIADGGGAGKYSIRDHTIIFSYSDGRILKVAYPGRDFDPGNQSPEELVLSYNEDVLLKQ